MNKKYVENIYISLIVPCYNEAPHLAKNLELVKSVLDSTVYAYEIIIIDDVSRDETLIIANNFISRYPEALISLIKHEKNQGRGQTVNDGIMAARGEVVGFVDIDFSTSPWYILPLVAEIKKGAAVVLGLRIYKLKFKVMHRWILSKGYKFLVKIFLGLNIGDTESGCKFFNRHKIIPILTQVKDKKWFWDTEIIVRSYLAGLEVVELPTVFVRESLYSRVKIIRDSWRHFINLVRFKREIKRAAILESKKFKI